jgi:hypothetical protein
VSSHANNDSYITASIPKFEDFTKTFGDDGKADLNAIASAHSITLELGPPSVSYNDCDIHEGKLRFLFNPNYLGSFVSDTLGKLGEVVSNTPHPTATMNLAARNGIKSNASALEAIQKEIATIVAVPTFVLKPNYEENYKILKESKASPNKWDEQLGQITVSYFVAWKNSLVNQGFDKDDMLQEGLQEAVDKNEAAFNVAAKLKSGSYNNAYIENGVFVLECEIGQFGVFVSDTGKNTQDLL